MGLVDSGLYGHIVKNKAKFGRMADGYIQSL